MFEILFGPIGHTTFVKLSNCERVKKKCQKFSVCAQLFLGNGFLYDVLFCMCRKSDFAVKNIIYTVTTNEDYNRYRHSSLFFPIRSNKEDPSCFVVSKEITIHG